jgi:limonene-1,2-epoxide hydrolase
VLEFQDGKIIRWREYFDASGLVVQALGTTVVHLGRRAGAIANGKLRAA